MSEAVAAATDPFLWISRMLPYRQDEVVGDLEVRGGIAAPGFGQPGGGVHELPNSVADLISRGILKPVG